MNKVQYFLIPADNIPRAVKFYQDIFGWEINPGDQPQRENYHSIKASSADDGGEKDQIYGGLFKRGEYNLAQVTVVIEVASIDECLGRLKKRGHEVIFPKTCIEGSGFYANVKDSEGNVIGLWEEDMET